MKKKLPQVAMWAITALLVLRLTYSAIQHDMPIADTLAIALAVPVSTHYGIQTIARGFNAARKAGADQS